MMAVSAISANRILPGLIEKAVPGTGSETKAGSVDKSDFSNLLADVIGSVNELQSESGTIQAALMAGEPVELHDVMIKLEESGLAMDLLLEIRNRLLSGYSELMRMPM
ncbi:MAG: flagellar hook-basal body complex protein FliE [candidate division Zixibacteria bacterium]